MAGRRSSSGLGIGQVITLTFGFLAASVLIFGFGWWVGFDVAEQRLAREQQVIRLPAQTLAPAPVATIAPPPSPVPSATVPGASATPVKPTATRPFPPTVVLPTATAKPNATAVPAPVADGAKGFAVQVIATTDVVQASILARRLREQGLDAYTVTAQIQGTMWYRVRVGHFKDRGEAQAMERRLRETEGMQAAFVTEQ